MRFAITHCKHKVSLHSFLLILSKPDPFLPASCSPDLVLAKSGRALQGGSYRLAILSNVLGRGAAVLSGWDGNVGNLGLLDLAVDRC
jgi:hypothetical protein